MAHAIRAKEFVIRSNSLGCLFKKIVTRLKKIVDCSSDWSYLFKDKFQPSFYLPRQFCRQPPQANEVFLSGHIAKFVYKRIMNSCVSFSAPLAIFAFIIIIRLSTVSTHNLFNTFLYNTFFFHFNKFPENNVLTFHRCMQNTSRSKDMVSPRRIHVVGSFRTCQLFLARKSLCLFTTIVLIHRFRFCHFGVSCYFHGSCLKLKVRGATQLYISHFCFDKSLYSGAVL